MIESAKRLFATKSSSKFVDIFVLMYPVSDIAEQLTLYEFEMYKVGYSLSVIMWVIAMLIPSL